MCWCNLLCSYSKFGCFLEFIVSHEQYHLYSQILYKNFQVIAILKNWKTEAFVDRSHIIIWRRILHSVAKKLFFFLFLQEKERRFLRFVAKPHMLGRGGRRGLLAARVIFFLSDEVFFSSSYNFFFSGGCVMGVLVRRYTEWFIYKRRNFSKVLYRNITFFLIFCFFVYMCVLFFLAFSSIL